MNQWSRGSLYKYTYKLALAVSAFENFPRFYLILVNDLQHYKELQPVKLRADLTSWQVGCRRPTNSFHKTVYSWPAIYYTVLPDGIHSKYRRLYNSEAEKLKGY
jgi:hypothetical protein